MTARFCFIPIIHLVVLHATPAQQVVVLPNHRIDLGGDKKFSFECQLSTHPSNRNLLAGVILTIDATATPSVYHTTLITSNNAGKSWSVFKNDFPYAADPWSLISRSGNIVVADIGNGAQFALGAHRLTNGKLEKAFDPLPGYDHALLVADHSGSKNDGAVYLIATRSLDSTSRDHSVLVMRSDNDGKSFKSKVLYPFKNANLNAKQPVVLSDGTLLIPVVMRGYFTADENKTKPIGEITSWIITSSDGINFSEPKFITPFSGGRHNMLVSNTAEKWKDQIYYVFPDTAQQFLYLCRSTDKGESWTTARKIVSDSLGFIGIGAAATDNEGRLGIIYNTRIQSAGKECYNWFFVCSADNGITFSSPVKINEGLSCPDKNQEWYITAWPQGGDYAGLVSTSNGKFLALWSDGRTGKFYSYTAEITVQ